MRNLMNPSSKRRRSRKFASDWTGKLGFGRLEDRALTAPAIFRRPTTDLLSLMDSLRSSTDAGGTWETGDHSAPSAAVYSDGIITVVNQANIIAIDLENPAPAGAAIGVFVAEFNASHKMTATASGVSVFNAPGARSELERNYLLADENAGNTGTWLRQRFDFSAKASGSVLAGAWVHLETPGLTIDAGIAGLPSGTLTFDGGTPIRFSAGDNTDTITIGTKEIEYSITISSTFTTVWSKDTFRKRDT